MVSSGLRLCSRHVYQKSLCLPKTKFPNRSNLQKTMDQLIPKSSQILYEEQFQMFLRQAQALNPHDRLEFVQEKLFVLHDGPPYANGDLHLGHAMNKILKDIINRFQLLQGKYIYYKTGWDCHGLPIELKALQKLTEDQDKLSPIKIRRLASQHAQKTIKSQRNQFQKYAIATNWDDHYETMQKKFELDQLTSLKKMIHTGLIKRQNKPVYWGTETKTALAESELEYKDDHISTSVYVKFPLSNKSSDSLRNTTSLNPHNDIKVVIWTTTPWTIFANEAICFNKNLRYGIYDCGDEYLLVQTDLKGKVLQDSSVNLVSELSGEALMNLRYITPFSHESNDKSFIHGDHVSNSTGTGFVHTAPGHGFDDYIIGIKNGLRIFSPVDNEGRYKLDELPPNLMRYLQEPDKGKARKVLSKQTVDQVLQVLKDYQMLLKAEEYVHSYPYDWRSKKPVIIRATPQWFADLTDVKELALRSLEKVKFYPERGRTRLTSFIKARNEWCISRQRSWGVPIPAFYKTDNCDEVLMNEDIVDHVISVIDKKGIDAWFKDDNSDIKEWLPPKYHHKAHQYSRGKDTVDVWFDSGSTWKVLEDFYLNQLGLHKTPTPLAQIYLEGSDQHRGWFQSSLLTKVATTSQPDAPYGTVITHGFTLDEKGLKMSKSIGNTVPPESVIAGDEKQGIPPLGVDGLRLLIAQADFTTDVVIGPTVTKHVAESLKKLRLTFKFLLGNLQKSDSECELLAFDKLRPVDQYVLCKLKELSGETLRNYTAYNFSKVLTTAFYHMNNQLSAFYLDIVKDSLYADAAGSLKRRQIQTTLFHILDTYRCIFGPIIPIMIQEAWDYLPKEWLQDKSEFHDMLPSASPLTRPWKHLNILDPNGIIDNFEQNQLVLLKKYNQAFKALPEITKTIQTQVTIITPEGTSLPFSEDSLADVLQVGRVLTKTSSKEHGTRITLGSGLKLDMILEPSSLHECPRCWKANSRTPESLCDRCCKTIT
ncbi:LANO_0E10110g1_1 [Lachancea nothofagi CBS 11611]|uniref:isoleucine--tRNA ligase n=1 Tax=Lachancea nothofagi CBS 11611 TaxID=1266666 RepID=A0A1G4JWA7_9SACH|nr:LANO_0E10110g1_1 [Lachancea nothofagi CBS 11611]